MTTASGSTFTIVNPHTPDEVQESIEKIWDDDGNRDGIRPRSIQVQLTGSTSDNPTVLTRIVTLSAANNWKETVTGLPRCNNGKVRRAVRPSPTGTRQVQPASRYPKFGMTRTTWTICGPSILRWLCWRTRKLTTSSV